MAMKEQPKQVHRSMQGKIVDMNKLISQNELTVAVGNIKVNARESLKSVKKYYVKLVQLLHHHS
jgi:hypothetical protein